MPRASSSRDEGMVTTNPEPTESRCAECGSATPPVEDADGVLRCANCGAERDDEAKPADDGTGSPGDPNGSGIAQGVGSRGKDRHRSRKRWTASDRELRIINETASAASITGLVIPYNAPATITDSFGQFVETVARGAAADVPDQDCALLYGHDGSANLVAARTTSSTLRLVDTPKGLRFTADLDVDGSPWAASLASAISRGDLDGMSWAFNVAVGGESWNSDMTSRTITRFARVPEISVVWTPAYGSNTSVAVVQAARSAASADVRRQLRRMHARNESLRHRIRQLELLERRPA